MSPTPPDRLHGLDALRASALLLGVVLHLTMSFLPGAKYVWIVADADPGPPLGLVFYGIHLFRMLTFFVLAGFFARMSVERLGVSAFIRDRWNRIALPLFVGWPLVLTAIVAVVVWSAVRANGGQLPAQSPPGPTFLPDDFPLTHLWFLWELLLLYAASLGLRWLVAAIDRYGHLRAGGDRLVRLMLMPGGVLLPSLPLAWALYAQPAWFAWFGIPTPDQALYPSLPAAIGFGSAFAFGWGLQRQSGLLARIAQHWGRHFGAAILFTGICLAIIGPTPVLSPAKADFSTAFYAASYAIAGWSASLAAIGVAMRFGSGHSPVRRYLADASYWIYLIHLPVVMAAQVAVARVDWPWQVKFPLILVVVCALLLASYHWGVRRTFVGAWLGGRRRRRGTTTGARGEPSQNVPSP